MATEDNVNPNIKEAFTTNLDKLYIGQNQNKKTEAKEVRNQFVHYFNNEGSVPWQNKCVKVLIYLDIRFGLSL